MESKQRVECGIVTFNPDLSRLRECIGSVYTQVSKVNIYDNGSANLEEITQISEEFGNVMSPIDGKTNRGMAVGLNSLLKVAKNHQADAMLLLDQDSVAQAELIKTLLPHLKGEYGMVVPAVIDRNKADDVSEEVQPRDVPSAITSGSLLSLDAYERTEGYDERLFVDAVDSNFCF